MRNGAPKYATALGTSNTPQGWRNNIVSGGVLMDVEHNNTVLEGLAMPHSPRWYNNELYLLLSASGEFVKVNADTSSYGVIKKFDGFCRGLSIYNDYAFIGFSKLRKNSSTFAKLPFSDKATTAGIKIIHLPTQALVGEPQSWVSCWTAGASVGLPGLVRCQYCLAHLSARGLH